MLKNVRGQAKNVDISSIKATVEAILVDTGTTLDAKIDAIKAVVDLVLVDTATTLEDKLDVIDGLIDTIETRTDFLDKTVFSQEAVAATDVNGVTWKDLLDKSTITKPTKICGFKLTAAGTWAGVAKVRITDGAGTKIWPFGDELVQDTDWVSGTQETLNFPIWVPIATGYKVQFRSSEAADGEDETLQLNNLDIIEVG